MTRYNGNNSTMFKLRKVRDAYRAGLVTSYQVDRYTITLTRHMDYPDCIGIAYRFITKKA